MRADAETLRAAWFPVWPSAKDIDESASATRISRNIFEKHLRPQLRIFIQLVADAANSQNVVRVLRITLQLLTQTVDVGIDVSLVAFILRAPDPIQQIVSRPRAARFGGQQLEYLELQRRQIDALTA